MYRSDRELVESILPIHLLYITVVEGADLDDPDIQAIRQLIVDAGADICANHDAKTIGKINRRAARVCTEVLAPFRKAEAKVSKFGLVVYYVLEHLRDWGYFHIEDGSALDRAVASLLHEDGSIVAAANVDEIDRSAQKQARKVLSVLQGRGLYQRVE